MKTEIYVIYDSKAKAYNKPFYQVNRDVALRTATDLANDPNVEISRYPEDYSLFCIGVYDDETAQMDLKASPEHVANLHELVVHGDS